MATKVHNTLTAFSKNCHGDISLEGVLWLPVYLFFLALLVDTSLMFHGRAQAQHIIQDMNRLASSGYYRQETEVENRAMAILSHLSPRVVVDATIDPTAKTITTIATIPASDLMAIGLISKFADIRVNVVARQVIEG